MDLFWTVAFTAVPLFLSIVGSYRLGHNRGMRKGFVIGSERVLNEWKKSIKYDYDWKNDDNN